MIPDIIVVMGVSGCGKSFIGRRIAAALQCVFVEGDDLHGPENIALMRAGIALNDERRKDWLATIQTRIREADQAGVSLVLSCSALKRRYRDYLRLGSSRLRFIYLAGSQELITARLMARKDHFMPPELINSQFADLEEPDSDEPVVRGDISLPPPQLLEQLLAHFPGSTGTQVN